MEQLEIQEKPLRVVSITREFRFEGRVLPDPSTNFTPQRVMEFYSGQYPKLTTATVADKGIEQGTNKRVYEFVTKFSDKG